MKTGAELKSEISSAAGEPAAQSQGEPSVARPLELETPTPAGAADAASGEGPFGPGAREERRAKALIAQLAGPSVEAEKISSAGETGRNNQVGDPSVPLASPPVAATDPLGDALAALDRRDYATAQRLFEALGRKDAAAAVGDALAALDRKDYATAQGLFEALGQKGAAAGQVKGSATAAPRGVASAGGPMASGFLDRETVISPLEVTPFVDRASERPLPQAEKAKSRSLRPLLLGACLVFFATTGAYAIYGPPLTGAFATTKTQAIAGLASAFDQLKAHLPAITGPSEEERSATRELSAKLTQVTTRLDQIEHEYGARLNKLGERADQDSSSRSADIAARLDKLEQKSALPATPASEFADVIARLDKLEKKVAVAAAPASEFADIATRLNRLEKKAAAAATSSSEFSDVVARLDRTEKRADVPAASSSKQTPKQSSLMTKAEPSNETARPENRRPLLRDYRIEDVGDGIALVGSRYGLQQVEPGDVIPGAGRVLRIERQGGDWVVVTSLGVIASGQAP